MLQKLESLIRAAGSLALTFANERSFEVEAKGPLDLVTAADRATEAFLLKALQEAFPEDGIIGEEGTSIRPDAKRQWIIDPIDGTFNFVRGLADWAVSIGLIEEGKPRLGAVYCPTRDRLFIGGALEGAWVNGKSLPKAAALEPSQGLISLGISSQAPVSRETGIIAAIMGDLRMSYRNGGSTAIALMQLAEGQIDAIIGVGNKSWDVAGGIAAGAALGYTSTVDFAAQAHGAPIDFIVGKAEVVAKLRALPAVGI